MSYKTIPEHPQFPPVSEVPVSEPPPHCRNVVPAPEAADGGLENIPEELLSPDEQANDELDHAGLDQQLPGADQGRAASKA